MDEWIGFDFDGTLAEYVGWNDGKLGRPLAPMVAIVKNYLAQGVECRIVTARAFAGERVTATDVAAQVASIQAWCLEHIGQELPVTCSKDYAMRLLYDDRAVTVERNTGIPLVEPQ